jgi:CRISPR/Cas system-associated endoribonuclease Cas2
MFHQKIKNKTSGILIYGITPPKLTTPLEKVAELSQKTIERIQALPVDALIVYDVQDESSRTKETRPFPFMPALDPLAYSLEYLADLKIPKIIYRPAGKYTQTELSDWFKALAENQCHPVLVGVPSPEYVPKISLPEAYEIWAAYKDTSVIGAISIPERHVVLQDEDLRMLDKICSGVSYFVTQCVFNVAYTKNMLTALKSRCEKEGHELPTVIFTLSTCGSVKTLEFMEWLGIHFPEEVKAPLLASENLLNDSTELCLQIARALSEYCTVHDIPYGFNIESVAIRKDEIEASIGLVHKIAEMLASEKLKY